MSQDFELSDEDRKAFQEAILRTEENTAKTNADFNAFLKKHQAKASEFRTKYGPDFDQQVVAFGINTAEQVVINEWLESLKPEIMATQKKTKSSDPLGQDEPYYGAIGGGVTYSFAPTGLGSILTVTETTTGKTLNVTAALDWYFFG